MDDSEGIVLAHEENIMLHPSSTLPVSVEMRLGAMQMAQHLKKSEEK